jgi:hypothetical protein
MVYPRKYINKKKINALGMQCIKVLIDFNWLFRILRPKICELWFLYSTSHVRLCSAYIKQTPSRKIVPLYYGLRIKNSFIDRELPQAQYLGYTSFVRNVLALCLSPLNQVIIRVPYISDFNLGSFAKVMLSDKPSRAVTFYDDGPVTFLEEALCKRKLLPPILYDFACWNQPNDRSNALKKRQVSFHYYTDLASQSTSTFPCPNPNELCHLIFLESKYMNYSLAYTILQSYHDSHLSFYDYMPSPHFSKNWTSVPNVLRIARSSYDAAEDHIINSPSYKIIIASGLSSTVLTISELLRQGFLTKDILFAICLDSSKCKDAGSKRELEEFSNLMQTRYLNWVLCCHTSDAISL